MSPSRGQILRKPTVAQCGKRLLPKACGERVRPHIFFARYLTLHLQVPVGIIVSAWGGTPAEVWTPAEVITEDEVLSKNKLKEYPWWPTTPGVAYNQMIYPLAPYRIAGCIWYKGESNHRNATSYARLLSQMIHAWRSDFGWDFPFYYVQIAPPCLWG